MDIETLCQKTQLTKREYDHLRLTAIDLGIYDRDESTEHLCRRILDLERNQRRPVLNLDSPDRRSNQRTFRRMQV
jgi:hypothetical protein